jgi:hypothetical protein
MSDTFEITCPSGMELEINRWRNRYAHLWTDKANAKLQTWRIHQKIADLVVARAVSSGPYSFELTGRLPWREVLHADLYYALFRCRVLSKGNKFDFDVSCPNPDCGEKIEWSLPLDDLDVYDITEDMVEAIRHNRSRIDFPLPESGRGVVFELYNGAVSERQARFTKRFGLNTDVVYASRLCSVEGVEKTDEAIADFMADDILPTDYDALVARIESYEIGVDSNYEIRCPEDGCGRVFGDDLGLTPDFFSDSYKAHKRRGHLRRRKKRSPGGDGSSDTPTTGAGETT